MPDAPPVTMATDPSRRMLSDLSQLFENLLGRLLAGTLLGIPLGSATEVAAHAHFHSEDFGMLRPMLPDDGISGRWQLQRLRALLQSALVVVDVLVARLRADIDVADNISKDQSPCYRQAAVQVQGGNQRFQCIRE